MRKDLSIGLLFIVLLVVFPSVLAQQGGYYRGINDDERYYDNNRGYQQQYHDDGGGGGYGDGAGGDNLYENYAARKNQKALGNNNFGWIKIVAGGFCGYIVGSTIQSRRTQSKVPKLRFKVKQRVKCKVDPFGNGGYEWRTGTIIKLWQQQDKATMPGVWCPYQIKLDDGTIVYAPNDNDMVIRSAA